MLKNLKLTLISLIASFTFLFPVSTFLIVHILRNNPNQIKAKDQNLKQQYIISKKQDITILLIISSEKEKYLIIKISPHDNIILMTDIPNNFRTIAQTNEGTPILEDTLKEIHKICGINFLKNSIESLTQINIDKILKIDQNAVDTILKTIGEVKILSKDKQTYNILKTKKFYQILNEEPKNAFYLLKNNFNKKTNLDRFFATLSNSCTHDITINDFQSRKKGFEKMIEEKNTKIIDLKIKTEKNNLKDKITESSIKELKKMYK